MVENCPRNCGTIRESEHKISVWLDSLVEWNDSNWGSVLRLSDEVHQYLMIIAIQVPSDS